MTTPLPAVGTVDPTAPPPPNVGSAADRGQLDPQAFLQLLVAQLQYQDPSSPVDTSAFMQQTAMLSQVQSMNSMLTSLKNLTQAQNAQEATALVGRTVTYADTSGVQHTGAVQSASLTAPTPTLTIGGAQVPLTSVLEVTAATTSAPASTTS